MAVTTAASRLGTSAFSDSARVELRPTSTREDVENVIRAVYRQVLGNDYYGRNERTIKPDGTLCQAEEVLGWYQITKDYYQRYRKPVMHTQTNVFDADEAPTWLWK